LRESKEGSAARVVHAREMTKGKWSGQHPGGVPRLPTASSETRTLRGRKSLCINALPYSHLRKTGTRLFVDSINRVCQATAQTHTDTIQPGSGSVVLRDL